MPTWNILALDPAISCGWAHGSRSWGVKQFAKRPWRHPYAHYLDFRAWLLALIDSLEVKALATEGVIATGKFVGNGSRHEWVGQLYAVAAECDLPVITVMPSSLKKYATGYGRAERPEMREALKLRFGIDLPEDQHDAIAAIWVLSWATAEAEAGRIERSWSGAPRGGGIGKPCYCNTCQHCFTGGVRCPRCGGNRIRLGA